MTTEHAQSTTAKLLTQEVDLIAPGHHHCDAEQGRCIFGSCFLQLLELLIDGVQVRLGHVDMVFLAAAIESHCTVVFSTSPFVVRRAALDLEHLIACARRTWLRALRLLLHVHPILLLEFLEARIGRKTVVIARVEVDTCRHVPCHLVIARLIHPTHHVHAGRVLRYVGPALVVRRIIRQQLMLTHEAVLAARRALVTLTTALSPELRASPSRGVHVMFLLVLLALALRLLLRTLRIVFLLLALRRVLRLILLPLGYVFLAVRLRGRVWRMKWGPKSVLAVRLRSRVCGRRGLRTHPRIRSKRSLWRGCCGGDGALVFAFGFEKVQGSEPLDVLGRIVEPHRASQRSGCVRAPRGNQLV
mmetsp:Transcript_81164/g.211646  ORF Transcript_81164/g.211646 Transcript_81164/m.211646 type:complete len:359 (+) Transcript_81164:800-1876(+)